MALQAAYSLLPSTTASIHKEGRFSASLKETNLTSFSFSNNLRSDKISIKKQRRQNPQFSTGIRAQTVTATPPANEASPEQKKTQRKGTAVITGASSGLGLATAKALADTGKWHKAAKSVGMSKEDYTVMHLDLASLESVKQFVDNYRRTERPLDVLVCNAAVYQPTAKEPSFTAEGFELSVGTNHLGNTNTLAGNVPPKANLGDLRGLASGLNGQNSSMIDGGEYDGAKAYKDSKVCNMLTMQELHRRYHEETGVTFASLYPGCIATTGLFREHIPLFRLLFPPFQKYITKGYVSEEEAGKRLAQVVSDPSLGKSGVYWSWNNNSSSFENQLSKEASDAEKAKKLWEVSEKLVGLA
ncbi:hypothetical protein Bca52824_074417 [Brassica carinata]|uniref:protochlorophyllide reductase n=1 Tax=Brassica carinata TaxID=52824 RepID=A0A8X7PR21_BRACI|nr:hypothetical protein Bca52824_074417 [Brassica carinata]